MSMSSGCLLEPATGFAGLLMTMASSLGFGCTFTASDNWSSSVYCLKVPDNGGVVDSTALTGHGGGCVTCLAAACLSASFHVLPVIVFSDHLLVNGSITSVMHLEVSPAFLLSQWRTFLSLSIPSFHSGHVVGALNHIQPSLLFGNLYWLSVSILYVPVRYRSPIDLQQSPSRSAILHYTLCSQSPFLFPSHLWHSSICPCSPCLTLRLYVPCFTDICFYATMILSSLA